MALRSIILTVKNPVNAAKFFTDVVGLKIRHQSDTSIELESSLKSNGIANQTPIILKEGMNAASLSNGYSPLLSFDVADMDSAITTAMQMGSVLDGPIKYPTYGKLAALRSPDGHMIGLFEPAVED